MYIGMDRISFYDNSSKAIICSKIKIFSTTHNEEIVGEDDGICDDGYLIWEKNIYIYGWLETFIPFA